MNEFFKLTNRFLCINFSGTICEKININDNHNLKCIHIFVFNSSDVNVKALKGILNAARRRRIKIIVHCFNKNDVKSLKMQLKGTLKDKYFHFTLNDKFEIAYNDEKKVVITYRNILFVTTSNDKVCRQSISYDYIVSENEEQRS